MRTKMFAVGAMAAALLAGGGLSLKRAQTPAKSPPPAAAQVPIVAGVVAQHDVPIYLTGVGTVVAYNTVSVRAQIQGQVVSINFTEGEAVRTGDLLAQIDPRPYQSQIDQLTAVRDRDQAQLTNALTNLNRYLPLYQKGVATQQLLDTQKAQVAQLENAVKADEAIINSAKLQLGYTRLTSPIDGITGIRQVDVGNIISPSSASGVVVVTQVEPISLIFTLPQQVLPQIQDHQVKTKGPLTVIAYNQDNSIKLDQGTLGLINNEIVQTTGSIQLKANFPNKVHRLWPGQLVNARLLLETRRNGLTVPASVVQQGQKGSYAYVIKPDNTAEIRSVSIAQISDGQALINSGLKANEQVVVDGQYKLQPGSHVRVLTGKAAEQADLQSAVQKAIP